MTAGAADPVRGEEDLIQTFLAPLAAGMPGAFGLADDCAIIAPPPGEEIVLNTDAVAAGVHFFADDRPADIAWKALAVNASDIAAKGARPLAYLMALAFPEAPSRSFMADFAAGLAEAQQAFGCHLAGGDTDRRPGPFSVTIMLAGTVPQGRMVRRGAARAGDLIYVSGTLGDAALGLKLRLDLRSAVASRLDASDLDLLLGRYLRPAPRLELGPALRTHASAAMDLSDGLVKDLGRMCRASAVGGVIRFADVPLSPAARKWLTHDPAAASDIVAGGDDFEILAAVPPDKAAPFETAAAAAGVRVTCIGSFVAGEGVDVRDAAGRPMQLRRPGWDHF